MLVAKGFDCIKAFRKFSFNNQGILVRSGVGKIICKLGGFSIPLLRQFTNNYIEQQGAQTAALWNASPYSFPFGYHLLVDHSLPSVGKVAFEPYQGLPTTSNSQKCAYQFLITSKTLSNETYQKLCLDLLAVRLQRRPYPENCTRI